MAFCNKCGTQLPDGANVCGNCGTPVGVPAPAPVPVPTYVDPTDHTAEFTAKDISDNKVIAMLVYLLGYVGIFIALLAGNTSPYAGFHVRQALKITVLETLLGIVTVFLCWTFIVPIAAGVCYIILFVVKIICFFSICSGKAKEPPIVKAFGFLK